MAKHSTAPADANGRVDEIHADLARNAAFRIGYRMCIWANLYNMRLLPTLQSEFDILRDEFNILFCLAEAGPATGTEVCRVIGRPRNSISRCAERLIRKGLIRARERKRDKRQTLFEILPQGQALYRSLLPRFVAQEEQMLASLTAEERASLDRILVKLIAHHGQWDRAS
jgi:DNA-binding MarR family transcriptional regulator